MSLRFARKTESEKAPGGASKLAERAVADRAPAAAKETPNDQTRTAPLTPSEIIRDQVLLRIEPMEAVKMGKGELAIFVNQLVALVASERKLLLNQDGARQPCERNRQ